MDLRNSANVDLKKIIEKECPDCIIIGDLWVNLDKLESYHKTNSSEFKQLAHEFLDDYLDKSHLKLSFKQKKIIILYREVLPTHIFLIIHDWIVKQCCDINNVFLVCPSVLGLKDWYKDYLKLFGCNGINIVECPWFAGGISSRHHDEENPNADLFLDWHFDTLDRDFKFVGKNLKYYFNYYGGSSRYKRGLLKNNLNFLERDFLVCLFSMVPNGFIDSEVGLQSPLDEFDNHLERLTGFLDRRICDKLLDQRKTLTFNHDRINSHPGVGNHGFIWDIDNQSPCHIIRETENTLPYTIVSEKSAKPFLHFQFPLPISGINAVQKFEELGFQMPHSIINYEYQKDPIFYSRVQKLCRELIRIQNTYTLSDLEDQLNDHREILQYNYNYIASGNVFDKVKNNLIRELNV